MKNGTYPKHQLISQKSGKVFFSTWHCMGKRYWAGNFYRSKILLVRDQVKSEYGMEKSHLIGLKEDFSARIILEGWVLIPAIDSFEPWSKIS